MALESSSIFRASQYKVLGGTDALPGEFPHQAQLEYLGHHLCGASVISSILILTAAHCVVNKRSESLKVVAGRVELNSQNENVNRRDVRMIFIHDNYNKLNHDHDIALLLLSHELQFNRLTRPILLRKLQGHTELGNAVVTGWGKLMEASIGGVERLQKVLVPLVSRDTCRSAYAPYRQNITKNMICAGVEGKDSCQGDSGGPLTCRTREGQMFLCGISSFGVGCGRRDFPGVYTDVSNHYDWIERKAAEINAFFRCPSNHFRCRMHWKCIPLSMLCNQRDDCGDRSDEEDCRLS